MLSTTARLCLRALAATSPRCLQLLQGPIVLEQLLGGNPAGPKGGQKRTCPAVSFNVPCVAWAGDESLLACLQAPPSGPPRSGLTAAPVLKRRVCSAEIKADSIPWRDSYDPSHQVCGSFSFVLST